MMKIIDFHTHPFDNLNDNIKIYHDNELSSFDFIKDEVSRAGIEKICGSVICKDLSPLESMKKSNQIALKLFKKNSDFYMPGVHIHPNFPKESCDEIEKAYKLGVRLIGELVPYMMGWSDYMSCYEIFDFARTLDMVISCHPSNDDDMNNIAKMFPTLKFVIAHPGEKNTLVAHIDRMQRYDNVYLDLSGTGLFRYGMLRHTINKVGAKRILFGSDYPICSPGMAVGGVLYEKLTDSERELIFYKNAERLLY